MRILQRYCMHVMFRKGLHRKLVVAVVVASLMLLLFNRHRASFSTGSSRLYYHVLFGETLLPEPNQALINYFGEYVQLNISVDSNFASGQLLGGGGFFTTRLTLSNTGSRDIPQSLWQLYGYFMRQVEHESFPYKDGFYIWSCGIKVFHVDGYLYKFQPVKDLFPGIPSGRSLECLIKLQAFQIAKTDSFPRWYVTGSDLSPRIVANTDDESLAFVSDLTRMEQYKRRPDDKSSPMTLAERYDMYHVPVAKAADINVLPTPLHVVVQTNLRMLFKRENMKIVNEAVFAKEIQLFAELSEMQVVYAKPTRNYIKITKAPVDVINELKGATPTLGYVANESYILESKPEDNSIHIVAPTSTGLFYAFQTLECILFAPEAGEGLTVEGAYISLPKFRIVDAPRFAYRGLHIDVSRNFLSLDEVLKLVDMMSMYKMNKLHMHLSDDEGWRLEIPGLPELTEIGGNRCHDPAGEKCLPPQLGSGPFNDTSGSGFYTVSDYRELLTYASEKHVQVIPEFDMPGHSRAAIKAVHAKAYQQRRRIAREEVYTIVDESDKNSFMSGQRFSDNAMNPCLAGTYKFVEKIIGAVQEMHRDIQPLTLFHFGGDEVASGAWKDSELCRKLFNRTSWFSSDPTQYELMQHFVTRVARIGALRGVSLGAWEDGLIEHVEEKGLPFPRDTFKNSDMYAYVWKRPKEVSTPHRAKLFANDDYKVVLSYGSYLYFDHQYEADPQERGLYWAASSVSTRDAWSLTEHALDADDDQDCPKGVKNKDECFKLLKPQNVVGIQAEVWSEVIRADGHMESMLFPRLLAVAERAWHKASWEDDVTNNVIKIKERDWSAFVSKLGFRELHRLEAFDIQYRVGPPGARLVNDRLMVNTEFPGQEVEYYSGHTREWSRVEPFMHVTPPIRLRASSASGRLKSREVILDPKQTSSSVAIATHSIGHMLITVVFVCAYFLLFNSII